MIALVFIVFVYQYPLFLTGRWNTITFIFSYGILVIVPVLYFGWKVWKKTKVRISHVSSQVRTPRLGIAQIVPLDEIRFFDEERKDLDRNS